MTLAPIDIHLRDQARWLVEMLVQSGGEITPYVEQQLRQWEEDGQERGERLVQSILALEELAAADRAEAERWARRARSREYAALSRRGRLTALMQTGVADLGWSPVRRIGTRTVRLVQPAEGEAHVRIELGEVR